VSQVESKPDQDTHVVIAEVEKKEAATLFQFHPINVTKSAKVRRRMSAPT
jgi:hypothetical protein